MRLARLSTIQAITRLAPYSFSLTIPKIVCGFGPFQATLLTILSDVCCLILTMPLLHNFQISATSIITTLKRFVLVQPRLTVAKPNAACIVRLVAIL